MSPRPTRPQALPPDQSLRLNILRPDPDYYRHHRNAQLDLMQYRHSAEEFGRGIGITLHWVFIKPFQLAYALLWAMWQVLLHIQMIMVIALSGMTLYVLAWVVYTIMVTVQSG